MCYGRFVLCYIMPLLLTIISYMAKKDSGLLWVIVPVVAVILVGLFVVLSRGGGSVDPTSADFVTHAKGNDDATVTLVEYADFQCPACASYHPVMDELRQLFADDQLRIEFRHLPLTQIHPNAAPAARATEAAERQGMFWEMHDVLFEKQREWSQSRNATALFRGYAEALGMDVDQFASDMKSSEVRRIVDQHAASARTLGLRGTPSFVLNGRVLENNPRSASEFAALIEAEGGVQIPAVEEISEDGEGEPAEEVSSEEENSLPAEQLL